MRRDPVEIAIIASFFLVFAAIIALISITAISIIDGLSLNVQDSVLMYTQIIIAFVGVSTAIIAVFGFINTSKHIDFAFEQNRLLKTQIELQTRAWVTLSIPTLVPKKINSDEELTITVKILNTGGGPAYIKDIRVFYLEQSSAEEFRWNMNSRGFTLSGFHRGILAPTINVDFRVHIRNQQVLDYLNSGQAALIMDCEYGTVILGDEVIDRERRTMATDADWIDQKLQDKTEDIASLIRITYPSSITAVKN